MYNKKWYNNINKSPYTPPGWFFGLVWTILYLLMIISFYLIWSNSKCFPYCNVLTIFLLQLAFNLSWTTVFFKYKKIRFALILTILIFILTFIVSIKFYKINKIATYLLIPYLLWLIVAMYLNIYIILKN
jgi:tryptophan-rich sensory protein